MRRILLIGILFIYVIHSLHIFGPFISYAVNKAYIISNFCINTNNPELHCDGKCYLKKELASASEESSQKHATVDILTYLSLHNPEEGVNCEEPQVQVIADRFHNFIQITFHSKSLTVSTPPPQSLLKSLG